MVIMLQFAKAVRFHKRNLPLGRFRQFWNLVSGLSNRSLGFDEFDDESDIFLIDYAVNCEHCNSTTYDKRNETRIRNYL